MKPKIGLVLSGGGARGVAHLGVMKALEEFGIRPDMISGTSAGAVAGAFYAGGYSYNEILDILKQTRFFSISSLSMKRQGLFSMKTFGEVFKKYFHHDSFEELRIPLFAAATDLVRGETAYFSSGSLSKSLKASSCIPFVFRPVHYLNRYWVDGGVLNNFPAEPLTGSCDIIIGIHVNSVSATMSGMNMLNVIERSFYLAMYHSVKDKFCKCDLFIEPPDMTRFSLFSFNNLQEIFDHGYQYTLSLEKRIKALEWTV